jgi:phosphatidylserine/phosphatidylglycerophosphate/cardiolipin synthase-like enzyme
MLRFWVVRFWVVFVLGVPFALSSPGRGSAAEAEIHYAPVENLEHIDIGLLRSAQRSIDFAAFILSDWVVVDALKDAVRRGVKVRIVLDGSQLIGTERLAEIRDAVRVKDRRPIMHLKAYQVDGKLLRTGSANFSASGLKKQDNDLILIRDAAAVRQFTSRFDAIFADAVPLRGP